MKTVLITGASGLIGSALCKQISDFHLVGLTRNKERAVNTNPNIVWIESLSELGKILPIGIINLAGESLANTRWSDSAKKNITDSRVNFTEELYHYFNEKNAAPDWLINASAIGYYGPNNSDEWLTEESESAKSFSSELCAQWEEKARLFESLGTRVCLARIGVVLSKRGGALSKMKPPFKFGMGASMGAGQQWMSWIHIDDVVASILFCIEHQITGPVNLVAPEPVTNKVFSKALADAMNRPCLFSMPSFVVRLMFGEMADELLLSGQRVKPKKLEDQSFNWLYPKLDDAMKSVV